MRDSSPYCIAVTATFTAEPIAAALRFWNETLAVDLEVAFAPFGQVMQSLLDPTSVLRSNRHGLNVVLFRYRDLGEPNRRQENLAALQQAILSLPAAAIPYLVIPCPEGETSWSPDSFLASLQSHSGVFGLSPQWISARYPVPFPYSPEGELLGAIPYTEDYFIALSAAIVRFAHSLQNPPAKVLALDCDNTLWHGVCGEDGPEAVRLLPGHAALQRFAAAQREQGTLLTLLSKNNQADVEATFAAHPEFPLSWPHISAHRINWEPKASGLSALASELSLGLDSFVFLDDNEKEVAEMAEDLPEVISLALPERSEELEVFVRHLWALDRFRLTETDRTRAESYERTQEFGRALGSANSLENFYASLELQVEVSGLSESDFIRAAQLTQRTNQFNLTTERLSVGELEALWTAHTEIFRIQVSDRFGDYGFTGLLLGKAAGRQYRVDNFLLSCRVLGRGVEHAVMRWLAEHAERLGLREVVLPFIKTERNQPAEAFLFSLGAAEFPFLAGVAALAEAQLRVDEAPRPAPDKRIQGSRRVRLIDYGRIARELSSVEKIKRAMRPKTQLSPENFATPTEFRLAALWQDLLPGAAARPESNFFELGGHSLLAVLLLTRIGESFGVELGIDEAYSIDMSLERMARRIDEALVFSGLGRRDYETLCEEIARMSDEEVAAALAIEDSQETAFAHANLIGG